VPPQREHAICLRHAEWSETSQVVTLFTRGAGVIRGLAKGSLRPRAAFSGGFETLTRGEIVYFDKRSGLSTLASWDVTDTARPFRTDLAAQRLGLYAVDLTAHLILDHDPHPRTHAALNELLDRLGAETALAARLRALAAFQTAILHEIGLLPDWGDPNPASDTQPSDHGRGGIYRFIPGSGELVPHTEAGGPNRSQHRSSVRADRSGWAVRASTVDLLRTLATGSDRGEAEGVADADRQRTVARAVALLDAWCAVALGARLPSSGVLEASLDEAGWRRSRDEVAWFASR